MAASTKRFSAVGRIVWDATLSPTPRGLSAWSECFSDRPKTRPHGKREVVARHAVDADKRRGAGLFDPKDNIESPKHRLVLGGGSCREYDGRKETESSETRSVVEGFTALRRLNWLRLVMALGD